MSEQPETLTKEQMAAKLGMSVEVFDTEIKNADQRSDVFEGLNRKERRKLQRLMRRKGVK